MVATLRLTDPGPKDIALGAMARARVLAGIDLMADAVAVTLGPRGRTVLIEKPNAMPEISRDGYTVARAIELGDRAADMGARILREVAYQTADSAGDGTTTAVILAGAMAREGLRATAAGLAPLAVKRGIDRATAAALAGLERRARPLRSTAEVAHIGTVAANGDRQIGELLARALDAIGQEGFVMVEEGSSREIELDIRDGMHVAGGHLSTHFVTDPGRGVVEMEEPYILLHDGKITSFDAVEPALRAFARSDKWLLVMAEDVVGEALATLVINRRDGDLKVAAVKAPGVGPRRKAMLEDIAVMTGAELVAAERGNSLAKLRPEMLGRAARVAAAADATTIVDGHGDRDAITARCGDLRATIKRERYLSYDREHTQQRLARLVSGIAVVRVGGDTEVEIKQRKEMVEDAVNATRAAVAEGILPGGGVALARCVADVAALDAASLGERAGIDVVRRALTIPLRRIAESGGEIGALTLVRATEHADPQWGFDARLGTYANMVQRGVIDPLRVVRVALANAASAAGLLITTEAVVAELPKAKRVVSAFPDEQIGPDD